MKNAPPDAFVDSVRHDPLFAAEGMDIDNANVAIESIEKRIREIERLVAINWKRKLFFLFFPLARDVFPVPFLRTFIESEKERRLFLADPSMGRAAALLKVWKRTARAFLGSTHRFRRMHTFARMFEPGLVRKKLYDAGGNVCTFDGILRQVELLEKNAEQLKEEVRLRAKLLSDPSTTYTAPAFPAPLEECVPPASTESVRRLNQYTTKRFDGYANIVESIGPFGYRLSNFDDAPTPHAFFVHFFKDEEAGFDYVRVDPVDLFYFLKLTEDRDYGRIGKDAFKSLIASGLPYWMQTGTRFYAQRDQQYWADILTLADRRRRPTLDTELVLREKSSLLDRLLGTCADELTEILFQAKARVRANAMTQYPLGQIFLAHSHPSVYFLPFNGSVWRLKENIDFRGGERYDRKSGVYLYEDLEDVVPTLSDDQLSKVTRGGGDRMMKWKKEG